MALATRAPRKASPIDPTDLPADPSIKVAALRDGKLTETNDGLRDILADVGTRAWIDLTDPTPATVEAIAAEIGLHPLVAEDIIGSNERAKVESVGDIIHIVMFVLTRADELQTHEIDFVLGERFVLSVHPAAWDPRTSHQLKLGIGTILARGTDFLLWALLDGIVDGYFPILDGYADEIDQIQDDIIDDPSKQVLQKVFEVKRDLIRLRHVVHPSREIFGRLTSREFDLIKDEQVFYFRDVYDHLIRLSDEYDSIRELAAGALEVYLSTVNNNLSAIMKRLTGVTVVLAGIAAIGGLFGMSEAPAALSGTEGGGFWIITIGTLLLAAIAIVVLRKIDWI